MAKKRKSAFPSNITHLPVVDGPDIECPIKDYVENPYSKPHAETIANNDLPFAEEDYFKGEKDEEMD